jgi:hypothetical protein
MGDGTNKNRRKRGELQWLAKKGVMQDYSKTVLHQALGQLWKPAWARESFFEATLCLPIGSE